MFSFGFMKLIDFVFYIDIHPKPVGFESII